MPNYVNNRDNDCSESDYKIIKSEFDYNTVSPPTSVPLRGWPK